MKYLKSFTIGIKVPVSIPRRRLLVTFLVLCITSTIFVVNTSFISDLQNVDQDFFGIHDNVFIIFNDRATTPFTSKLPDTIITTTERIPGVLAVSPELLQPATVNDQAIYARGGELDNLIKIENYVGTITPQINDTQFVGSVAVIGIDLASRLNVNIGDEITIHSILNNNIVTVKILAIISGYKVYSDEVIIPLSLARTLSLTRANEIGHLRVKYDKSVVSESEIKALATQEYKLTINLIYGNGTNFNQRIFLTLFNQENVEMFTTEAQAIQSYFLPIGNYSVQFQDYYQASIDVLGNLTFNLNHNLNLTYTTNNFTYKTSIQVTDGTSKVSSATIQINNNENQYLGFTNEDGLYTVNVATGTYNITVQTSYLKYYRQLLVNSSSTTYIDLEHPFSDLFQISNNSIITTKNLDLRFTNPVKSYSLFYDNQYKGSITTDISVTRIHIDLKEGQHNFTLINTLGFIEQAVIFTVNYSYTALSQTKLIQNAHYLPYSAIIVDTRGFFNHTFSVWINNETIPVIKLNSSYSKFIFPDTYGIVNVKITYTLFGMLPQTQQWIVAIDSQEITAGWVTTVPIPDFKLGDTLEFWMKNTSSITLDSSWELKPLSTSGHYAIRSLISNTTLWLQQDTLSLSIDKHTVNLDFNPITAYSFSIYENNSLHPLTTEFNYSKITIAYTENQYKVSLNIGSIVYTIASNQSVFLPKEYSSIVLNISNILSHNFELYTLHLNITTENIPLLLHGYSSLFYSATVNFESQLNTNVTLYWQSNNSIFLQFQTFAFTPTIKYLPFGSFYANISNSVTNTFYVWNFTIVATINTSSVILNVGEYLTVNNTILFASTNDTYVLPNIISYYFINDSRNYYATSFSSIKLNGDFITNSSSINLQLSENVFAYYTIDYLNGTTYSAIYSGNITFVTIPSVTNVTITVTGLDQFNQSFYLTQDIFLNQEYKQITFEFFNRTLDKVQNINFQITETNISKITVLHITNATNIYTYNSLTDKIYFKLFDLTGIPLAFQVQQTNNSHYIIYVGSPILQLNFTIPNTDDFGKFQGYVLYHLLNSSTVYNYNFQNTNALSLPVGTYNFTFVYSSWRTSTVLTMNFSLFYKIQFPVVKHSFTLILDSSIRDTTISVEAYHVILKTKLQGNLTVNAPLTYTFDNFPIGEVIFRIRSVKINVDYKTSIYNSEDTYYVTLDVLTGDTSYDSVSKYLNKNLDNYDFGYAESNSYLDVFLGRTFLIINVILIAQIFLIFLISFFNISILMRSVIQESLPEIKILKSVGASRTTTLLSIGREIFVSSIISGAIGLLLAKIIIILFNKTNNLVIFGHKFVPELDNPVIIITNLLLIFVLTVISAYYAYHIELTENELV